MKKLIIVTVFFLLLKPVFAHVVVKPESAPVGTFQTFIVSVPNEKEMPVSGLRLTIPPGLGHVTPNVKPGWTIEIKKDENKSVTTIDWHGGSIPVGLREEFIFSAQVPSTEGDLAWKAYQTYQDGTVVSWDQDSQKEEDDHTNSGPFSVTHVVNDLVKKPEPQGKKDTLPLTISIAALALAIVALVKKNG